MKRNFKRICILSSALALATVIGGCGGGDRGRNVEYVQTHQQDEITRLRAVMFQNNADEDRIGTIKFGEKDSGLQMSVDLSGAMPDMEYKIYAYDIKGCDIKQIGIDQTIIICVKAKKDISLPIIRSDGKGNINSTYMITGLTAADLNNTKLVLARTNAKGDEIEVGFGALRERVLF
ncbi:MAG: hypothetical protein FWC61_02785 [Proteobacteria bacterium]|nr:hypothetical protein [Pseudomonadota bacterium]